MNFAVGFVILFCLFCSEYSAAGTADHLLLRLGGIVVLTSLVPSLALLQTFIVNRRRKLLHVDDALWEQVCNRVNSCHTAVWLAASVATIYVFRWHDVVRSDWGLGRFVLVDEVLILMPVLLSLLASWAVFYDLKSTNEMLADEPLADEVIAPPFKNGIHVDKSTPLSVQELRPAWWFSASRQEFVLIRFRLYVLVLMVPLLLAVAVNDSIAMVFQLGPVAAVTCIVCGGLAMLALLPMLAGLPWKLASPSEDLNTMVRQELAGFNLGGLRVREWDTGDQIINAAAVGMLPWFRQLWVSDRLIRLFPEGELKAIVRHEVAHLQLSHAAIRSALLLLPVSVVSIVGWLRWGDPMAVGSIADCVDASVFEVAVVMSALYMIYAAVTLRAVSHASEFEADLLACCMPVEQQAKLGTQNRLQVCHRRWEEMLRAIERLAVCMPSQIDNKSVLHPSLRARMNALQFARFRIRTRTPDQLIASNRRWAVGAAAVVAAMIAFSIATL